MSILSNSERDAIMRIPLVEYVEEVPGCSMGLVVYTKACLYRGYDLLPIPPLQIHIRTSGTGPRFKTKDANGRPIYILRSTDNYALCLGNISHTMTLLMRQRDWPAVVNLLTQFLQEG